LPSNLKIDFLLCLLNLGQTSMVVNSLTTLKFRWNT